MLLANSKQSVTMSEYQSCVIPSLSLCLKTNIQLINEHEECPLEQFEKKKFKLYSQKVAKKSKLTLADGV